MGFADVRTHFRLDINPSCLDRTGNLVKGDDPESRLSGSVEILGTWHHLDLIEIVYDHDTYTAANLGLEQDLEALDQYTGEAAMEPVEINGRYYVCILIPFCR